MLSIIYIYIYIHIILYPSEYNEDWDVFDTRCGSSRSATSPPCGSSTFGISALAVENHHF